MSHESCYGSMLSTMTGWWFDMLMIFPIVLTNGREAKDMIATSLVAAGACLKATDNFAESLVKSAGSVSVLDTCKPASLTAKISNLRKLANKLQIPMRDLAHQAMKVQQKWKDRVKNGAINVDPQDLPK